jgi:2-C-methyl-D-erythritol 4-phosphate cytidylyltransferase
VSGPVWAIVVAAGSGSRFGGPKQYEVLAGRRVLDWSLDAARQSCDGVVLVVPPDRARDPEPVDAVVAGGTTRSGSVRNGLARIPAGAEVIAVHDAARPLATPPLFDAAIAAVRAGAAGAVCAVPLTDTVKRVDGADVAETLDRRQLVAVQTPQAFAAAGLREAHARQPEATDDAAVVEAAGGRVVVVPGDPYNLKITSRADLAVAEALLALRSTA